jgi:ABC-type molybdenum transport system ATPase subunit/photorepair protein PhrA
MIEKAKQYLLERLEPQQAVVLVTHWKEEVPWPSSVVQQMELKGGTCIYVGN